MNIWKLMKFFHGSDCKRSKPVFARKNKKSPTSAVFRYNYKPLTCKV